MDKADRRRVARNIRCTGFRRLLSDVMWYLKQFRIGVLRLRFSAHQSRQNDISLFVANGMQLLQQRCIIPALTFLAAALCRKAAARKES